MGGQGTGGLAAGGGGEVVLLPNYADLGAHPWPVGGLYDDPASAAALDRCRALAEAGRVAAVIVEPGSWMRGGVSPLPCANGDCGGASCCGGVAGGPPHRGHTSAEAEAIDRAWLHALQQFCRDTGCLFVLDEIVTGFRFEGGVKKRYGLEPDVVLYGKPLGGGMPLACLVSSATLAQGGG